MPAILPIWRPGVPPGVYARAPQTTRTTPTVRMDICAFVGLTRRGPVGVPVEIDGWPAFTERFGPAGGGALLPECVAQFFANGGARCVVIRHLEAGGTLAYPLEGFAAAPRLRAATAGWWLADTRASVRFTLRRVPGAFTAVGPEVRYEGPRLPVGVTLRLVDATGAQSLHRITAAEDASSVQRLTVVPAPGPDMLGQAHEVRFDLEVSLPGAMDQRFADLALDPAHPDHPRHRLAGDPDLRWEDDGIPLIPRPDGPNAVPDSRVQTTPGIPFSEQYDAERPDLVTRSGLLGRADALDAFDRAHPAAPVTMIHICDLVHVDAEHVPEEETRLEQPGGTSTTFVPCGDVPSVAVPHRALLYPQLHWEHDPEGIAVVQAALVEAQRGTRRIALLDVPPHLPAEQVATWRHRFESDRAAAFGPWLVTTGAATDRPDRVVPPGGAVAGVWASTVQAFGVGRAPANRAVPNVLRVFAGQQLPAAGEAHALHLNLIRPTPDGYTVLGARTLSTDPDWVHVNVRRTMDWLAMQLPIDHAWAVFEPNDRHLERRIGVGLRRRLLGLFEADALEGATPEEAFFYEVGDPDSRATDRDAGLLRVRVGVSPSVPMEFLVIELLLDTVGRSAEVRDA